MSDTSAVVADMVDVLRAALPEVDSWDVAGYTPAITTQGVALIATALGHSDSGYMYSAGWMQVVHRMRFEFWVRYDTGNPGPCITTARDLGYRAMRALVAADVTGGYTLMAADSGEAMGASVDPTPLVVGELPFLRCVLTVPVWQKETV
jgi:hypothetical protein